MDSILQCTQNPELPPAQAALIGKALHEIAAHPNLVNVSDPVSESPLYVTLGNLSINVNGTILGDL